MSESERESLSQILRGATSSAARWLKGSENALVTWAIMTLLFVLAWMLITWAARAILHVQIGRDSPASLWAVGLGAVACATYAVVSSVRLVKAWPDIRPEIRADLEEGKVANTFQARCWTLETHTS